MMQGSINNENIKLTSYDVRILCLTVLLGVCSSFGIDMHLPSLPYIVQSFHSTRHLGQVSISIYLLGMLVMQLFYGPLSDKLGRKPIVLLGLTVAIIGGVVCINANSMPVFLSGRLIQGLGAAVGMGLGRTIITDTMSKTKMAMYGSFASVFMTVGMMIAPVLGGYLQSGFGWRANFIVMTAFFFTCALVALLLLPETCEHKNPDAMNLKQLFHNYFTLLKSPVFFIFNLMSGLALGAAMGYTNISPFLFQIQYHMSPVSYGWLGVVIGCGGIVGKFMSGVVVRRTKIEMGIWLGMIIISLAGILLLVAAIFQLLSVVTILVLIFVCVIGQGFIFANAMAGAMTPFRHIGGCAGALYGSLQYSVGFIVSAVIAAIPFHGAGVLAGVYLLLGLIGLVTFSRLKSAS